ncbi:50S ribosomal protein L19 [Roseibacillus ishigakijimensis]|uniref:Large ribosomal subunit protein bL19 n=1 Tax=Roseibacillus ishigakijimensis TaxID=454146 RepID=A0A934RQC8_9BACT|nr:50S ribosomal protein L19 [Roseibacillus ishigakijimensis]
MSTIIDKIEQEQQKDDIPEFGVGDSVKIHCLVKEGDKERTQIFAGLVIARRGGGVNASYTVRKISYGEGVERVFPLHTPRVAKIEVTSRGKVRRAKLHYLRDRVGKRALLVKPADSNAAAKAREAKKEAAAAARAKKAESEAAESAE